MYFGITGEIKDVETIAIGGRIRDIMRIQKQFGHGRWRKLKGEHSRFFATLTHFW